MRALLKFRNPEHRDPRVWLLIPEAEGWYPLLVEVTEAVLALELLPQGRFRAMMIERPLRVVNHRLAKYEIAGTYEVLA